MAQTNNTQIVGEGVQPYGSPQSLQPGNVPPPGAQGGGLDVMTIVRMVLRRWALVLFCGALGFTSGYFYHRQATPIFSAESEIEMSVRRPRITNSDVVFEDGNAARDTDIIFNTRFAKFRSPAMEDLVKKEFFKRYSAIEYIQRDSGVGLEKLGYWVRRVRWQKDGRANIVHVAFESWDPVFAAQLVNVMTDCAGQLMMAENQALSDGAVQWLLAQVKEQRESLELVEYKLAALRQELQLDSLQQRKSVLGRTVGTLTQEKAALESQLASRKTVLEFMLGLKVSKDSLETLPSGLPKEGELGELMATWRAANEQLLLIADRFTDVHPQYQQAAEVEERARQRLEKFIKVSTRSVENEIQLLEKQVKQMEERITIMNAESIDLDKRLAKGTGQLQRLQRQRDAADVSYQSILNRMEEARLAADENTAFVKVIREAAVPVVPVAPDRTKMLAIGLIIGILAGAGLVLLLELMLDKVSSVSELRAMHPTILGTLPNVKDGKSRSQLAMVGVRNKFSPVVEVFAGINSTICSGKYRGSTQVLLVCSAMPGEGKTITASNMAISSARNGTKTLLIDGDLRRPRIADIFEVDKEHPSLLEWIAEGDSDLDHDHLIFQDVVDGLDVITSRPVEGISPAEILGRNQLGELIQWARENYDRIIIDSPPLRPVGDALVLADHADSVVLVSRINVSRRRALRFVLSHLAEIDANVLGFIANDVPHSLAGKFGGGEGYGYGHNYNSYING